MTHHPTLDEKAIWALKVIEKGMDEDPEYLKDAPYPVEIMRLFQGGYEDVPAGDLGDLDVMVEIQRLYSQLQVTKTELQRGDSAEKIAFFRLAVGLLEKMVGLSERANNVRQIGLFHTAVLDVLEQYLNPVEITKVRAKLLAAGGAV